MGLYGERVGALHVVTSDRTVAANVADQLRCIIRWEFSSSPAYGSRLATIILTSEKMKALWYRCKCFSPLLELTHAQAARRRGDEEKIVTQQGQIAYVFDTNIKGNWYRSLRVELNDSQHHLADTWRVGSYSS